MSLIKREIAGNFDAFSASWQNELRSNIVSLTDKSDMFLVSYTRITAINAWRTNVLEHHISNGSLAFFVEALNDALTSHVLARCGSWRIALTSLRGCIENTLYCLYYMDHPVELRLWEKGQHRPGFSEMHTYFEKHPALAGKGNSPTCGLAILKSEYGTLSRAVHASAQTFRMSLDAKEVALWNSSSVSLGMWLTREQQTFCGLNLLLISLFKELLQGTQQLALRRNLGFVISDAMRSRIKSEYKVNIPSV